MFLCDMIHLLAAIE